MASGHSPIRNTARLEGDFVILLIGMRMNQPWAIHRWLPLARSMQQMITELAQRPDSGYLGSEMGFGRTILMVQYWRSIEHLHSYANDPAFRHRPAWQAFYRGANGSVGFWHESYSVRNGEYESIYVDMPPFGLGAAAMLEPATGKMVRAADRIAANVGGA